MGSCPARCCRRPPSGTMSDARDEVLDDDGVVWLDFSLNSTVRGSVALTESMYCHIVAKVTERGLAELEGEDDVVGGEVGPVGPLGAVLKRQQ